ncbi:hypothetical protein H0H87_001733 [Tephrocybe sp. NHM501043]|nr:hypothetical protein H0H87_001733 [Tephrocybe sp. NHM501043]
MSYKTAQYGFIIIKRAELVPLLSTGLEASSSSSKATKAELCTQIAHDVQLLKQSVLALKRRHNSISLPARLPPEMLMIVFEWLLHMSYSNDDNQSYNPQTPWVRVSFVCSYWRHAALDCPSLWTKIFVEKGTEVSDEGIKHLQNDAFSNALPNLRRLSLTGGWTIPSTFWSLSRLTSLGLNDLNQPGGPNLHQLLDVLKSATNLERLSLGNAFCPSDDYPDIDAITFPRLNFLKITSSVRGLQAAYSQIVHPVTVRIELTLTRKNIMYDTGFESDIEPTRALFSMIGNRLREIDQLRVTHTDVVYTFELRTGAPIEWSTVEVADEYHLFPDHRHIFFRVACESLPLTKIHSLETNRLEIEEGLWIDLFGDLEFLTTITIRRSFLRLAFALGKNPQDGNRIYQSNVRRTPLAFPSVTRMILEDLDFGPYSLEAFATIFQDRSNRGVKFQSLRFASCILEYDLHDREIVWRLQHLVEEDIKFFKMRYYRYSQSMGI